MREIRTGGTVMARLLHIGGGQLTRNVRKIRQTSIPINIANNSIRTWDGVIFHQDKPPPHPLPFRVVLCWGNAR